MNDKWAYEKKKEMSKLYDKIVTQLRNANIFKNGDITNIIKHIEKSTFNHGSDPDAVYDIFPKLLFPNHDQERIKQWLDQIDYRKFFTLILRYKHTSDYWKYVDSNPMAVDGDIIVTDPSYIIRDNDWNDYISEYFSESMKAPTHQNYGGMSFLCRDIMYRHTGCCLYNAATHKAIANFTTNSRLVGIFHLHEAIAYNPSLRYTKSISHNVALIHNFKGYVWFEAIAPPDHSYLRTGKVYVVGKGFDVEKDQPLNFKSEF